MRTHTLGELKDLEDGTEVIVGGWVHDFRNFGKLRFVLLRDRTGFAQVTAKKGVVSDEIIEEMDYPKETVLLVKGKIKKSERAKLGFEIIPSDIKVVGRVYGKVPFDITDPEAIPHLDVRLDNRHVDLRRPEIQRIFQVRATVQQAFREYFIERGFLEIVPTTLVDAATEGGADLFPVQYFEKRLFLAQSPQLYKQIAIVGGLDKVFMQGPVFRAEPHNTTTHLNEIWQMDVEMAFTDDNGAMDALEGVFKHILERVKERHMPNLKVPEEIPRITYDEALNLLKKKGVELEWGEDFNREHERLIGEAAGVEAYFITKWPTRVRAFYSMPEEDNAEICKAFDFMYKGLEISSGAQRIHDPELLVKQLKYHGLKPEEFEFYINTFRAGAPPHAGWSIGAERLTMKILDLPNIREATLFPRDRHRTSP